MNDLLGYRVLVILKRGNPVRGRYLGIHRGRFQISQEVRSREKPISIQKEKVEKIIPIPEKSQDCLAYLVEASQKKVTQKRRVTRHNHPKKKGDL